MTVRFKTRMWCWAWLRQAVMRFARAAWLELVRANHPDQLQARGLPPEMMHIATARMAAINDAWETIRKERGL